MGDIIGVTPTDAWNLGTNIRSAMKVDEQHEQAIRMWIVTEVAKLCKEVDANKTLATDDELRFCCRSIIEDFPALKLEELRACFDMLRAGKFGKLYERLKTPEILEALRRYEGEVRSPIMERQIHNQKWDMQERMGNAMKESKEVQQVVSKLDATTPKKPKDSGLGQRLKKHLGTE